MIHADVSARPAVPGDEEAIAAIQLACWRETLGPAVDALPSDDVRAQWAAAIAQPPSRDHRVFVACDGPRVVGFAALAPTEILALEVAPDHRRAGHGSRLLSACIDTLRTRGATETRAWSLEDDAPRRAFLESAGFGEGGLRRTLDGPTGDLVELMYRAAL
ncbi:GNAT family N-acetyltransferase [Demequina pelophila]|uniref:GNAT family N-acetyltransferase n=1 Tax=Demequina pelophila TaxID=1638984 RepID=UPI00078392CE|nr:GNAT family N-acetyltransferase [Demequina pelophila]